MVYGASPSRGWAGGRVQVHRRGPRRVGPGGLADQTDGLVRKSEAGITGPEQRGHPVPLQHAAAIIWTSTAPRPQPLGVPAQDVNQTLQIYMGSLYVNSFNDFGRHWQVTSRPRATSAIASRIEPVAGAEQPGTNGPCWARSSRPREIGGPIAVTRYNLYTSAWSTAISPPATARATHQAIDKMAGETLPLVDENRMDRTDVPADPGGQHSDLRFLPGGDLRVPGPVGPLRKLVAAAGGDSGRAAVPAVFRGGRAVYRTAMSTSSCRSAWSCWSVWRARTRS